jgi:hypothetical protein
MSYETLADRLECSPNLIRQLVKQGKLPAPVRLSYKIRRFDPAAVEDRLNELAGAV